MPVSRENHATGIESHLDRVGFMVEESKRKNASTSKCSSIGRSLTRRCEGKPHPGAVLDVIRGCVLLRSSYQCSIGKLGNYVERCCLSRRYIFEHARKRIGRVRLIECDGIISLEINARVCIVDVSDVVIAVPEDHNLVLHSELEVCESNWSVSASYGISIDPQVNLHSWNRRGAIQGFTQDCDASAPSKYC